MSILNFVFISFIISFCVILWSRRKYYKLIFELPGRIGYPLLGNALQIKQRDEILNSMKEKEAEYGGLFLSWIGPFPIAVVSEPQIAKDILTSPNCVNKSFVYKGVEDATGPGLFTINEPEWSYHRKLLNPAFGHKILLNFIPIFNKEVDHLMEVFKTITDVDGVDLVPILQKFTLKIATQTTMGQNLKHHGSAVDESLLQSFPYVQETITEMGTLSWLSMKAMIWILGDYEQYKRSKTAIRKFIGNLITARTKTLPDQLKLDGNIFINRAIELLQQGRFSRKNVEDESIVIVFGAFETTATTLKHILILLAMHPQCQERAFEEVSSLWPESGSFEMNYSDIQKLSYVSMVIDETMRVMATVPVVGRQLLSDTKLSNGVVLPKGIQVLIDIFNMQRREDIWGTEAHLFNPENFLPSNIDSKHSYAYIPFTKGIRNCIGSKYALLSLKIAVSKLVRNFRFTTDFQYNNLHFVENITIKLKQTPLIRIHKRQM
ncbi:probable cytochrome P450 313a4 isoform X3 [Bactrocera dorsalis]|uniref:Probable cytochrome P450 313a4 isoform X2 n=1 Tax=Bactrocera dorsalis TaxID=27457 RepID=A0ABM3J6B4_BACDO|nr:probable cytochrome P450 313a4 isoform X2 [Bactrocera dorsalis]XP_049304754.1 probable cytochrome P450 313a4 isoform X3 [Bactrocera dorsalis]